MEKTGREKLKNIQKKMEEDQIGFLIMSQAKSFEHLVFTAIPFMCIVKSSAEPRIFTHFESVDIVREQTWVKNITGIYPYNIGIEKKSDVEEDYLKKTVEYIRSFEKFDKKVGMDLANTPAAVFKFFKNNLKEYEFADFTPLLNKIYSINTSEEIALIKKAAKIAELGVIKTKEFMEDSCKDITENELAAYAEYHMRKSGVDGFL